MVGLKYGRPWLIVRSAGTQILLGRFLQQIATRPRRQGPQYVRFVGVHAEEHDLQLRLMLDRALGDVDAVQPRHGDIEDRHVGPMRFAHPQRFQAVTGFADDFDVVFRVEQRLQSAPHNSMIITEHYSQRGPPCCCPQRAPAA